MVYLSLLVTNLVQGFNDSFAFTPYCLLYNIGFRDKHNYRRLKYVVNGIAELQEHLQLNIPLIHEDHYACSCSFGVAGKDYYTILYLDEIECIVKEYDFKTSGQLLKYYGLLLSTFIKPNKSEHKDSHLYMGNRSLQDMSDMCGYSTRSLIRYNEQLSKIRLLYIYNKNHSVDSDCVYLKNMYCRWQDRNRLIEYGDRKYSEYNGIAKMSTKHKQKCAMIYRHMLQGKVYPKEIVKEVYKYICYRNKGYQKILDSPEYSEDKKRDIQNKIVDVKIFEPYGFI